ncbi:hypothetical protein ACQ4PT_063879 [Festuca glaucescens]
MPLPRAGLVELKLDYAGTSDLAIGHGVCTWEVSGGEHTWRILCYPRGGYTQEDNGEYLSLYLEQMSKGRHVCFVFNAYLVKKDGSPCPEVVYTITHDYPSSEGAFQTMGWEQFARRSDLESLYVVDGVLKIICTITVLNDDNFAVPSSDIGNHLGQHLDRAEGTDVSFVVGDKTFHAHRAVLAARSPVFRAQLLGSMADATMSCIRLHDMEPATFRILLRFMYTDVLPADEELTGPSLKMTEFLQNLIAASDKYDLPRLKLICSQKLGETVSVETVMTLLDFADMNNCPELTNRCLDFLVAGDNFKRVAVTDQYFELGPSFIKKMRKIAPSLPPRPSPPRLKKMRMW